MKMSMKVELVGVMMSIVGCGQADGGDPGGGSSDTTSTATESGSSTTPGGGSGEDPLLAEATCSSNQYWTRGEGTTMRPGEACVACHTAEREGPLYAIAGTLYPTGHEPDDCNGASVSSGAKVVITDADGVDHELTPNQVGNFYLNGSIATPYTAKVVSSAGERLMFSPQTNGDCNLCHTADGVSGAPGRVVVPF